MGTERLPAVLDASGNTIGYLSCSAVYVNSDRCGNCKHRDKNIEEEHRQIKERLKEIERVNRKQMLVLQEANIARDYFQSRYLEMYKYLVRTIQCHSCQDSLENLFVLRCGHQICQPCADKYLLSLGESIDSGILEVPCPLYQQDSSPSNDSCHYQGPAMEVDDGMRHFPWQYDRVRRLALGELDEDDKFEFAQDSFRPYLRLRDYMYKQESSL